MVIEWQFLIQVYRSGQKEKKKNTLILVGSAVIVRQGKHYNENSDHFQTQIFLTYAAN